MLDSYIILHRKTKCIIKVFILNFYLIVFLVIWGINTLNYQSFFQFHTLILKENSFYYLEVLIPVKEVNQIANQNKILIDTKEYTYHVYKIDSKLVYQNKQNYQKVYLKIDNLEEEYQMNGYQVDVKILKKDQKIVDYIKSKKEEK